MCKSDNKECAKNAPSAAAFRFRKPRHLEVEARWVKKLILILVFAQKCTIVP